MQNHKFVRTAEMLEECPPSWKHGWIGDMSMQGSTNTEYARKKQEQATLDYNTEFQEFQKRVVHGASGGNITKEVEWSNHGRWDSKDAVNEVVVGGVRQQNQHVVK